MDAILDLEEQLIEEGKQEGYQHGLKVGHEEGRELGFQHGFEIGHEIGYYFGAVQMWAFLLSSQPSAFPARATSALASFNEQLSAFPVPTPQGGVDPSRLSSLRSKFRALASLMGQPRVALHLLQPPSASLLSDF